VIPASTIRIEPRQPNGDVAVNTGSPHSLRIVEHEWPQKVVKEAIARSRGTDPVNFDLVRIVNPFHFRARVFERGVGETFSCGTGAAAIVAALGTFDSSPGRPHQVEFASGEQLTVTHHRSPDAFEVGGRVELLMAASVTTES
jgi:diaminopimelate epimerase